MRRRAGLGALVLLLTLLAPTVTWAHPLGNFTVNHYSRLEPSGDGVQVVYVLDMAEIPTFQERWRVDADRDGNVSDDEQERHADALAEELRRNLHLSLDGTPAPLRLASRTLSFPEGQGGLPTLRLEAVYGADLPPGAGQPVELTYRDGNYPQRLGWREIVARPGEPGTAIQQTSVPADDQTDELRGYPDDLLNSPLDVRAARLTFVAGAAAAAPPVVARERSVERPSDAYAALAAVEELSLPVALGALVAAMALGALHALSPGHGKTVVAAYLVGSRGTAKHALFLGATVTATHTIGVYALGLVTLTLSQYVLPEDLYPILQVVSGLLVVGIGGALLVGRLKRIRGHGAHEQGAHGHHAHDHSGHGHHSHHHGVWPHPHPHPHEYGYSPHPHSHGHGGGLHPHPHPHADTAGSTTTWRSLLALGVSGGLLPCPSALVVLLSAIALHRVAFGLLLIVAFSIGLAAVLVGIGLLLVYARGFFSRRLHFGSTLATRLLPVASALVITVVGVAMTVQALPRPQ
jgi:ABC-type nickel/cobalt efflux system permease component RcnA